MITDLRTKNESSNNWKEIYSKLKDIKADTGASIQQRLLDYQKALRDVIILPSMLKPYMKEAGVEFPKNDIAAINKTIDDARKVSLGKVKLK